MRGIAYSANSGAFQLVETAPRGLLCVKSSRHWKWLKKCRVWIVAPPVSDFGDADSSDFPEYACQLFQRAGGAVQFVIAENQVSAFAWYMQVLDAHYRLVYAPRTTGTDVSEDVEFVFLANIRVDASDDVGIMLPPVNTVLERLMLMFGLLFDRRILSVSG